MLTYLVIGLDLLAIYLAINAMRYAKKAKYHADLALKLLAI